MELSFKNKVVVITGGAGGIGTALITQLLSYDAKVAVLDLDISTVIPSNNLLTIAVDISDTDLLTKVIDEILNHYGQIDILINNAGITHMRKFTDLSAELFDKIMAVNFFSSINITRLCLPHLKKTQGQIIAMSSVAGFAPLYGRTAYSASKHAMQGFFGSLASEIKDEGIAVTIVCPSFVRSRPELLANPTADLLSPGATKISTGGEQIDPVMAAKLILKATAKRQRYLYLGKVSKIARWLFALLPETYMKVMTKSAKKEFIQG